ncbi:MAG: hypothetical protein ABID61_06530, partial [Candidatus Micrarchaeota archaeon]
TLSNVIISDWYAGIAIPGDFTPASNINIDGVTISSTVLGILVSNLTDSNFNNVTITDSSIGALLGLHNSSLSNLSISEPAISISLDDDADLNITVGLWIMMDNGSSTTGTINGATIQDVDFAFVLVTFDTIYSDSFAANLNITNINTSNNTFGNFLISVEFNDSNLSSNATFNIDHFAIDDLVFSAILYSGEYTISSPTTSEFSVLPSGLFTFDKYIAIENRVDVYPNGSFSNLTFHYTETELQAHGTSEEYLAMFYLYGNRSSTSPIPDWYHLNEEFDYGGITLTHNEDEDYFLLSGGFNFTNTTVFALFAGGGTSNSTTITTTTYITTSTGGSTITTSLPILSAAYNFICPDDELLVEVTKEGLSMPFVHVSLLYYGLDGSLTPISTRTTTTNLNGQTSFDELAAGMYKLSASFDNTQPYTTQFIYPECTPPIPQIEPNKSITYFCKSSNDCADSEYCEKGECKQVLGECGYSKDHQFYEYECCIQTGCGKGLVCSNHLCVQPSYSILTDDSGYLGGKLKGRIVINDEPAINRDIRVSKPNGRTITIYTDDDGYIEFPLDELGNFAIYAGNAFKTIEVSNLPDVPTNQTIQPNNQFPVIGDSGGLIAGGGIAVAAILIAAALAYRVSGFGRK